MPTIILEGHATDVRRDLWCDHCRAFTAWELDVAVADGDTLAVLARTTAVICDACGREDHYRR